MRETKETTFSICAGTTFDGMVSKIGDRYEATFEKFETIRDTEKPVIFNPSFTNLTNCEHEREMNQKALFLNSRELI